MPCGPGRYGSTTVLLHDSAQSGDCCRVRLLFAARATSRPYPSVRAWLDRVAAQPHHIAIAG